MSGNAERFERAMNQGHNAAWDQMWDRAAEFYRQALEEFPAEPKTLTSLALALYETEQLEEALVYYKKAAQLTPEDPIPLEKVAELLERTGQSEHALDAFMRSAELYLKNRDVNKGIDLWNHILSLRPGHLLARSRLALVFERLGRKADALREYLAIASLLQNSGEVQKAFQAVNRAMQVSPGNNDAQQALNMIKTGRLLPLPSQPRHGAVSQLAAGRVKTGELPPGDVVAQLDPVSETLQKSLSALAALLFDQDEQEMNIRRGMADIVRGAFGADSGQVEQTKIMLHLSQVIEYHSRKKDAQAAEELERAIEIGLEHPAAYFSLGCFQVAQKRSEKAINNLERVTGHPEYALAVHILLGQAQMELQQHHAAVVDLLEALKLAEMQVVLADQSALLGQAYDPIIESQAELRDGAPPIRLCETIMEMLARPDWRAYLQEARKQLPDQDESNPTPLADLITAAGSREVVDALSSLQQLTRKGKYNAAMEQAFHALRTAPFYLPLHVAIGDVLLQEGQFGPALDKFNTVARSYEIRGETNRAISLYHKIADLSPLDMAAHNNLITLMIANGRNDDAINEYLVLSELYYNLADLGNVQNSINEAMRLAVQSNASKAVKLKVLGHQLDIELQSLNWRQAQKTYEQIRALQPEDEATRFALIDLDFRLEQEKKAEAEIANFVNYMAQRRMMDKVVSFMNQLAEKYPQQPLVLRQYAEVLRQMGRREEAIQKLDIAGDLYMQAGNKNATMEVVMAILAMNPPNAAEYQQLLAQLRGG